MADSTGHLPRGPGRILKAAQWSMQGLRAAWLHESSFRLEVFLFVVLAPLAWWLGETPVERALIAPPHCRIGAITDEERNTVRMRSPVGAKYDTTMNRELEATGWVAALRYLRQCRGGEYVAMPQD